MPQNPYDAPLHLIEPPKVRSRLMTIIDLFAILGAAMPLLAYLGIFAFWILFRPTYNDIDRLHAEHMPSLVALTVTILVASAASGLYNLFGALRGRRTGYFGLLANILSFAVWFVVIVDDIKSGQ